MHTNAATLLNLFRLSVAVASIATGLFATLGRAPSAGPLVLHGRKLSQVSVSTVAELTTAVGDSAVDKIFVAAGTYDLTSNMCSGSAVCIDRALTIEAQVPGSVVLDAKGGRRVFEIKPSGTAELIGLNITGGSASSVQSVCLLNLLQHFLQRPMERYALHFLACRAVVSLSTPTEWLTLKAAISMTTRLLTCACIFEPFPELSSIAPLVMLTVDGVLWQSGVSSGAKSNPHM